MITERSVNGIIERYLSDSTKPIREERDWRHFLDSQYQRYWKVHFAKKTDNILQTVSYLGRYLKRPHVTIRKVIYLPCYNVTISTLPDDLHYSKKIADKY